MGKRKTAEIWDPATEGWTSAGETEIPRAKHQASLLPDGRVLVTGALGNKVETEIYDPESNTWTSGPDMSASRYHHVALTLSDGSVIITGGFGQKKSLALSELYTQ